MAGPANSSSSPKRPFVGRMSISDQEKHQYHAHKRDQPRDHHAHGLSDFRTRE